MTGFIKYMRSEEAEFLLKYPNANHLFMVMAFRARRTDHPMNGLKAGQCFLGDYSSIGMTRQQYRTAQEQLTKWNLATFKGTNKGTIGTIVNSKVYDINSDESNQQVTIKQPTNNQPTTTNKECKNEIKKENKRFAPPSIEEVFEHLSDSGYPYKIEAEKFWNYYESNGWKVGKNKMKNWKSAATGWIKRTNLPKKQVQQTAVPPANYDPLEALRKL